MITAASDRELSPSSPLCPSPWRPIREHLERNALRPMPALDGAPAEVPQARHRAAAAAILARFQLGETGEGRLAREIYQCRLPGVDPDYQRAIELQVKEEGRHARILASAVRALGGQLLHRKASTDLFRVSRRLLGLRFKLLVVLVAEVGGGAMYNALVEWLARRPTDVAPLRAALAQIAQDERVHFDFHAAFFRVQGRVWWRRWALRLAFWAVGLAALLVVLAENAGDARALGVAPAALGRSFWDGLCAADRAAFAQTVGALAEVAS
jgi:hypothetical protein